jgi:endoglucanase
VLRILIASLLLSATPCFAACFPGANSPAPQVSVTTIQPTGTTGFDMTLASNSYNYTLYPGNPSLWGNLQPGGYVEFTVSVAAPGSYALEAYYATPLQGALESLSVNGAYQSSLSLASTGSWGNTILSSPAAIYLPSGQSVLRIAVEGTYQAYNLVGLLVSAPAAVSTPTITPALTNLITLNPNGPTSVNITQDSNASGYTLYQGQPSIWGDLQAGGFVEYALSATGGSYALQLQYATSLGSGAAVLVNGVTQQSVTMPTTGSWNTYDWNAPVTLTLPTGTSVLRLAAQNPVEPFNLEGMTLAPAPTLASAGSNPFGGASFYVSPWSEAAENVTASCSNYYPGSTGLIAKIANHAQGVWFGDWNTNVESDAASVISAAVAARATPIMVAYDIPIRDCAGDSGGGAINAAAYQTWIQGLAHGIGNANAVVILEPDALSQLDNAGCLNTSQRAERISLLNFAVSSFQQLAPQASVYIDAGDAGATVPAEMAQRLASAGIANAAGFSLNVSNYMATDVTTSYGQQISALTGNKLFVIDTSRNGLGPTADNQWCNAPNRGLGSPSQGFATGLTDAFLWVQNPGTSDGTCNGGPPAGQFSVPIACTLAHNAIF